MSDFLGTGEGAGAVVDLKVCKGQKKGWGGGHTC